MLSREAAQRIFDRFTALEQSMADNPNPEDYARLGREYTELQPIVAGIETQRDLERQQDDLEAVMAEETDSEFIELASAELIDIRSRRTVAEADLQRLLLPDDGLDRRNVILEIRPGTGGEEAALFAYDLMRMYQRYCELHSWSWSILTLNEIDRGGIRELIAHISGENVFARLKHESGVHRVQRVPVTESQGRVHTSTATVAILPEAHEVDIAIEAKDLRIDVYRSGGPGGQSVNTTDSAVRITHLPTGVVAMQQDEKSQHKNRAKAMSILKARLFDLERQREQEKRSAMRRKQVGSGDRSERIRTYNFPQGRVSDHRIGLNLYKIEAVLCGDALDEFIDPLRLAEQAEEIGRLNE